MLVFFVGNYLNAYSIDLEYVEKYINKKFAEAKVETEPFPHIIIDNILPEDLYSDLLLHWPNDAFEAKPLYTWRKSLGICGWPGIDEYSYKLWKQFAIITNQIIKRKIGELFHKYSAHRFGKEVNGKFLCDSADLDEHKLVQDYGDGIKPHIDQAYIFAVAIIYFPELNDYSHTCLSTRFYKHNSNRESVDICFDSNVKLVKAVDYKPNRLCAFMQTPHSWHSGAQDHPFGSYARKLYLTHIYLSSKFLKKHYGSTFFLETNQTNGLDEANCY